MIRYMTGLRDYSTLRSYIGCPVLYPGQPTGILVDVHGSAPHRVTILLPDGAIDQPVHPEMTIAYRLPNAILR